MQEFRKFLCEDDGDRARIACVYRNRKPTRVAIIAIDVAFCFPNAVGVSGWMMLKPNEEDFGPEIPIECMLRFNDREIVACRNNASVEDNKIIVSRNKN